MLYHLMHTFFHLTVVVGLPPFPGNKKPLPIGGEEVRQPCALFPSFPESLSIRAGIGTWSSQTRCDRLPWFHRASPSTTHDETVDDLSTDADR